VQAEVSARTAQRERVLRPCRVKAKPPSRRGQSRGLDPFTVGGIPMAANSQQPAAKEEAAPTAGHIDHA
jgi:hypothetical protein